VRGVDHDARRPRCESSDVGQIKLAWPRPCATARRGISRARGAVHRARRRGTSRAGRCIMPRRRGTSRARPESAAPRARAVSLALPAAQINRAVVLIAMAAGGAARVSAEPGHRGLVIGIGLVASLGTGDGAGGGEVMLGWSEGQVAVADEPAHRRWTEPRLLHHERRCGALLVRLALRRGTAGHERMELSEADSFDGPEIDSSLDGVFAGVGWEIVRHPRVVPLDFRVGVDLPGARG
jgi:hypothetical protein